MRFQVLLSFLTIGLMCQYTTQSIPADVEVLYEWAEVEWDWASTPYNSRESAIAAGYYQPNICIVSTVQVARKSGGPPRIFTISPRIAGTGVPSGLSRIGNGGKLVPFPDAATNKIGDCKALQSPQGMVFDPKGKLYVVDGGRVGILTPTPQNNCPAKLMVISAWTGNVERIYEFPDDVVDSTFNFFNDLVIDYVNPNAGCNDAPKFAYMTEPFGYRIVVLDLSSGDSWYFQHPSMLGDDGGINVTVGTFSFNIPPNPVNGIILSPSFDYVYYSALTSRDLWQIPTSVLRQKGGDFAGNVRKVGSKSSNSDSMFGGRNAMYYGGIDGNAFYTWGFANDLQAAGGDEKQITLTSEVEIAQDDVALQWPDGVAIDTDQNLYFVSDRAHLVGVALDPTGGMGSNVRIFKKKVNDKSYLDF